MISLSDTQSPQNILGTTLKLCCADPKTGFFRDGFCNTNHQDQGLHTVCAVMTEEFLAFSKSRGNDLSTSRPEYDFPGLKPGDLWCLCALRWKEAFDAGVAPAIKANSTHSKTLDHIKLEDLKKHFIEK